MVHVIVETDKNGIFCFQGGGAKVAAWAHGGLEDVVPGIWRRCQRQYLFPSADMNRFKI